MAAWDREERAHDDAAARLRPIIAPPYVPWPGDDPLSDEPEERTDPDDPKWVN
jgi:hypothetical protein